MIIVVLVVLIVLVVAYSQYASPDLMCYVDKFNDDLYWTTVDNLFNEANNGDLIFISGNT